MLMAVAVGGGRMAQITAPSSAASGNGRKAV